MKNNHDTIIYGIVGLIIFIQLFFFLKNFRKIMSYKSIMANNENLSLIELNIEEDKASLLDPDYFLENKGLYGSNRTTKSEDRFDEIDETEISNEFDYDPSFNSEEINDDDDDDDDDDFDDNGERNLFS